MIVNLTYSEILHHTDTCYLLAFKTMLTMYHQIRYSDDLSRSFDGHRPRRHVPLRSTMALEYVRITIADIQNAMNTITRHSNPCGELFPISISAPPLPKDYNTQALDSK